jgi:hypothetical protein
MGDGWGGQSAHVVDFVIVSPAPIRSCCIFCARTTKRPARTQFCRSRLAPIRCQQLPVRHLNRRVGSPSHHSTFVEMVGFHRNAACCTGSPVGATPSWQDRTNNWHGVTSPARERAPGARLSIVGPALVGPLNGTEAAPDSIPKSSFRFIVSLLVSSSHFPPGVNG